MNSKFKNLNIFIASSDLRIIGGVHGVLQHRVVGRKIDGVGGLDGVASREPERARPTDHRQLPSVVHDLIPAEEAELAAGELPGREVEVEVHGDAVGGEVGVGGEALHAAHGAGVHLRPRGDQVVQDVDTAEVVGGILCDGGGGHLRHGGIDVADAEVLHVEMELCHLFFGVTNFFLSETIGKQKHICSY